MLHSARARFLVLGVALLALAVIACGGAAPAEPVTVEVTRIVEQSGPEVTRIVEQPGPEVTREVQVEVTREVPVEVTRVVEESASGRRSRRNLSFIRVAASPWLIRSSSNSKGRRALT